LEARLVSRKLLSPLRDSALNRNMARQAVNNSAKQLKQLLKRKDKRLKELAQKAKQTDLVYQIHQTIFVRRVFNPFAEKGNGESIGRDQPCFQYIVKPACATFQQLKQLLKRKDKRLKELSQKAKQTDLVYQIHQTCDQRL
jgi:formate dehydrogenase maturation protein FdhE